MEAKLKAGAKVGRPGQPGSGVMYETLNFYNPEFTSVP